MSTPARPLSLRRRFPVPVVAVIAASIAAAPLDAQIIQIKTLPVADAEQWRFFPSSNLGLGGVSIALPDSLLDPFVNPASGVRLSERSRGLFFGSPTFYSISKNAGGGRTLPLGGIMRRGSTFGGAAVAIQEIDGIPRQPNFFGTVLDAATLNSIAPPQPTTDAPRRNRFAFATLGHLFQSAGISVGASAMWSGLKDVDGVDLLYAGSQRIEQHGGAFNARLGLLKEWSGGRSLEGIFVHDRFNMTHDVTWVDPVWNPNTRQTIGMARTDHNFDKTNIWGLHLAYSQPFADSGWRAGAIVTTNLMSHPKLPDFQIAQVMTIPWDPGHSAAYDLGLGIAKVKGNTTFGLDAIFEPIRTHTWGETPSEIITDFGSVPAGGKTTENWFRFSNAIVRTGLARDIPLDTLRIAVKSVRFELGLALRSIGYTMNQHNHVSRLDRQRNESWMEWTRSWGWGMRFSDLDVRYVGRMTTGTGRPGIIADGNFGVSPVADLASAGRNFLSAPNGATTLTQVAVTTHQISISLPVR